MTGIIQDEEMGAVPFVIFRRHMIHADGRNEPETAEEIPVRGAVQPAGDQDLLLTPEEYRSQKLLTFYAPIPFSTGNREDKLHYTEPDQILYDSKVFLVIAVKDLSAFGFSRAVAVEKKRLPV